MPDSVSEWGWWILSTIIVGFVLSIVANLATPVFKQTGQGWLQRRRLKKDEYYGQIIETALELQEHPSILLFQLLPNLVTLLVFIVFMLFLIGFQGQISMRWQLEPPADEDLLVFGSRMLDGLFYCLVLFYINLIYRSFKIFNYVKDLRSVYATMYLIEPSEGDEQLTDDMQGSDDSREYTNEPTESE